MDEDRQNLTEQTLALAGEITAGLQNLLLPSRLTQIAVLIAILAVAFLLNRWFGPKLHEWMRTLEGWPKWRLRVLVVLHQDVVARTQVVLVIGCSTSDLDT